MLPAQPNRSLIDGLALLHAVTHAAEPVGSRRLARDLGLDTTRVNRLLKTLAHLGFTHQDHARRYAAGPAVHVLAAQALRASGLINRALDPLQELADTGLTVAMGVLWQTEVCYVYFASPGDRLASALGSRDPHPASLSGLGLALLADLPDAEVRRRYADHDAIPGHPDLDSLLDAVAHARSAGHALCTTDRPAGQATLAVKVGQPAYAAIGLAGRLPARRLPTLIRRLDSAARRIESSDAPR